MRLRARLGTISRRRGGRLAGILAGEPSRWRRVDAKAVEAGVTRLVLLSSRAVFGQPSPPGSWVDDDTRPVPDTHYGALKLALEAHASAFAAVHGVCFCSLRPTGVYGVTYPVERTKWLDLALRLARNEPLPEARLATEVHGEDVAAAVWILLTAQADLVTGRAFNCSDLAVDTHDVMAALAEGLRIRQGAAVACDERVAKSDALGRSSEPRLASRGRYATQRHHRRTGCRSDRCHGRLTVTASHRASRHSSATSGGADPPSPGSLR